MEVHPGHIACIFGGGVAGSEAASRLAERGVYSVVFEKGALPWGKIELGLPKWHAKQRDQEEKRIDSNLKNSYVNYVPLTELGHDITLEEALEVGFSVVLLAVGAWKDRPLSIPEIDRYVGRGFYYQNSFVSWFNQYHSPDYDGPKIELSDGAVVVGGGLASLDVVKILMLEATIRALEERGHKVSLFELEKKGIPKTLDQLGVEWEELGLQGCTLYYRRRAKDMPLIPVEDDTEVTPQKASQLEKVRKKLLDNFQRKYLFDFVPCSVPVDKIVEDDRLTGLIFRKTEIHDGKVKPIPGTEFPVKTPLVISSIGSIPESIPGVKMDRELFNIRNLSTGQLEGFDNVFALGNAVTGRGNIRASRLHGRSVTEWILENHLDWQDEGYSRLLELLEEEDTRILERFVSENGLKKSEEIEHILQIVRKHQSRVGYSGDYEAWVEEHSPVRLEAATE